MFVWWSLHIIRRHRLCNFHLQLKLLLRANSDNSGMRWHDLLIWSMPVFILRMVWICYRCTSNECQRWYPKLRKPNRLVSAIVHCNLKVTAAFMPPEHISCSRYNVQNDNVVQAKPLINTCFDAYGTGFSCSAVWHKLYEWKFYPFHVYLVKRATTRAQ
jgi:hypothetical protein